MKKILVFLVAVIAISSCVQKSTNNYKLVWQDEFDYTGLPDSTKWVYDLGNGQGGWGNGESQFYTNDTSNIMVANGKLVISARKEPVGGFNYTSARIKSKHKYSFQYGRIEVSAKLPGGAGLWPAAWMLGSDIDSVGWPACGEIDFMEYRGSNPGIIQAALHTPSSSGNTVNVQSVSVADCETAFHVYTAEWDEKQIKFFVDTTVFYIYKPEIFNNKTWPYNSAMFILLNVAVGGTFGGTIDEHVFPQAMEIDYVRVYQKN